MMLVTENTHDTQTIDYERFEKLMKEKKWKASELGKYAGLDYNTAYAIFTGRRPNPNSDTLMAICKALGCTTDYLLGRSNQRYPVTDKLPEQVRQLTRIAGKLSETRQEELLRIAETLEELESRRPVYTVAGNMIDQILALIEGLGSEGDTVVIKEMLRSVFARGMQPGLITFTPSQDNGESLQN